MDSRAVLDMRGIVKTFGGVAALRGVDLGVARGSVHALVGENGAGKSTLIKVMTGATSPDAGTIALDGARVTLRTPEDAQAHGIVAVYQEVNVLSHGTVAENLFLGREPHRFGLVDSRKMHDAARALLAALGLSLDPRVVLGELPISLRHMVSIARGVSLGRNVLVLDEPTSSLTPGEVNLLVDLVHRIQQRGTAVVYISHRLDEVYSLCDTVTVLRDGERVLTAPLADVTRVELVTQMTGSTRASRMRVEGSPRDESAAARDAEPRLRVADLRREPSLRGVTFDASPGEIVGLAGLLGAGRTETLRAIFGADRIDSGSVRIEGAELERHAPRDALDAGAALVPEDRAADGIIPQLSVRENLTLAVVRSVARLGVLSRAKERAIVDDLVERLRIKARDIEQSIRELSGGNQQKVLLARCLCLDPKLLLVDEPTRGIDVGAKAEIHAVLADLARRGVAIVLVSSELDELASASARIIVLRDGASVAELRGGDVEPNAIVRAIAGGDVRRGAAP